MAGQSNEAEQRVEYHLQQAFQVAESGSAKYHIRQAAAQLGQTSEVTPDG